MWSSYNITLSFREKKNLKRSDKYVAISILSMYDTWKIIIIIIIIIKSYNVKW